MWGGGTLTGVSWHSSSPGNAHGFVGVLVAGVVAGAVLGLSSLPAVSPQLDTATRHMPIASASVTTRLVICDIDIASF
jgi:hypothetical protein